MTRDKIEGTPAQPAVEPGSFDDRVSSRRVNLVQLARDGMPPVEYLPASDGMLIRGKRHLIVAPRKTGKSLTMLVHWVQMALAGARVVILDRENGSDVYASRLESIIAAWEVHRPRERKLRANLYYYEFPQLRAGDGDDLATLADGAALVVFDAQRMFLTDLGLREGESDDYSQFMAALIDPLFRRGIATVILDNTGHADPSRSRGSSAKGDLNEVLFVLKAESQFSSNRRGKARLVLDAGNSRFGNDGVWEMQIGGGEFSGWERVDQRQADDSAFRTAAIEVLRGAGESGLSMSALLSRVRERGATFGNQAARAWLHQYGDDPTIPVRMVPDGQSKTLYFSGGDGQ